MDMVINMITLELRNGSFKDKEIKRNNLESILQSIDIEVFLNFFRQTNISAELLSMIVKYIDDFHVSMPNNENPVYFLSLIKTIFNELKNFHVSSVTPEQLVMITGFVIKMIFCLTGNPYMLLIISLVDISTDIILIDYNSIVEVRCNITKYLPKCLCK